MQYITRVRDTITYRTENTDWELIGDCTEYGGSILEWTYLISHTNDSLLIKNTNTKTTLLIMIVNSACIHITGDGEMNLHERGIQAIYSPFMSYTIQLEKDQQYSWLCIRLSEEKETQLFNQNPKHAYNQSHQHPGFLFKQPKIWPNKIVHELHKFGPNKTDPNVPSIYYTPENLELILNRIQHINNFLNQPASISLPLARDLYNQKNKILNYALQRLSPSEILDLAQLPSKERLKKNIKQLYGCNTTDLINQFRVQFAADALLFQSMSIKQLAAFLGYSNVQHFTRVFKSYYSIPPRKYQLLYSDKTDKE